VAYVADVHGAGSWPSFARVDVGHAEQRDTAVLDAFDEGVVE
jgi:hypothetical protein